MIHSFSSYVNESVASQLFLASGGKDTSKVSDGGGVLSTVTGVASNILPMYIMSKMMNKTQPVIPPGGSPPIPKRRMGRGKIGLMIAGGAAVGLGAKYLYDKLKVNESVASQLALAGGGGSAAAESSSGLGDEVTNGAVMYGSHAAISGGTSVVKGQFAKRAAAKAVAAAAANTATTVGSGVASQATTRAADMAAAAAETAAKHKAELSAISKTAQTATMKGTSGIAQGLGSGADDAAGAVAKAGAGKTIAKTAATAGVKTAALKTGGILAAKTAARMVPGIATAMAGYEAYNEFSKGNIWRGLAQTALAGVALIPVPGVSIAAGVASAGLSTASNTGVLDSDENKSKAEGETTTPEEGTNVTNAIGVGSGSGISETDSQGNRFDGNRYSQREKDINQAKSTRLDPNIAADDPRSFQRNKETGLLEKGKGYDNSAKKNPFSKIDPDTGQVRTNQVVSNASGGVDVINRASSSRSTSLEREFDARQSTTMHSNLTQKQEINTGTGTRSETQSNTAVITNTADSPGRMIAGNTSSASADISIDDEAKYRDAAVAASNADSKTRQDTLTKDTAENELVRKEREAAASREAENKNKFKLWSGN